LSVKLNRFSKNFGSGRKKLNEEKNTYE